MPKLMHYVRTTRRVKTLTISLTPSNGVDVSGGRLTPVVITVAPSIKVNQ